MTIGSHQTARGKSTTYITPKWVIDALGGATSFDLDPAGADPRPWDCAVETYMIPVIPGETRKQQNERSLRSGGMILPWRGRIWLNPPFDELAGAFVAKLAAHPGGGIALLHVRPETAWFRKVWAHASAILFLDNRLHFHRQNGQREPANSGAPVCLCAFGGFDAEKLRASGIHGYYINQWEKQ